jgi:hypothetical protein
MPGKRQFGASSAHGRFFSLTGSPRKIAPTAPSRSSSRSFSLVDA